MMHYLGRKSYSVTEVFWRCLYGLFPRKSLTCSITRAQSVSFSNLLLHFKTDKKLIIPEIALLCHTQLKSVLELKRYLQEEGLKTSRVFLHKPHFPIKLCGFFPLRVKKHFMVIVLLRNKGLVFPWNWYDFSALGHFPRTIAFIPLLGKFPAEQEFTLAWTNEGSRQQ